MKFGRKYDVCVGGLCATVAGGATLQMALNYVNDRAFIVQRFLDQHPKLTQDAYNAAVESANTVLNRSDFVGILLGAGMTGSLAGLTVYHAFRKD